MGTRSTSWTSSLWTLLSFLIHHATAGQECGIIGTHNSSTTEIYMGNFFYRSPSTLSICADLCRKDTSKCKSFRYSYYADADAQYCEFFTASVDDYFIADDSQQYYYYDVGCPLAPWAITETTFVTTTTTVGFPSPTSTLINTTTPTLVTASPATSTSSISALLPLFEVYTTMKSIIKPITITTTTSLPAKTVTTVKSTTVTKEITQSRKPCGTITRILTVGARVMPVTSISTRTVTSQGGKASTTTIRSTSTRTITSGGKASTTTISRISTKFRTHTSTKIVISTRH